MTLFETVPPIAVRALEGDGRKVLEAIAASQRAGMRAGLGAIKRRARINANSVTIDTLHALDNGGLIVLDCPTLQNWRATLTEEGWGVVGNKPFGLTP
jgi:RIO-like serine/threonine protein kinase